MNMLRRAENFVNKMRQKSTNVQVEYHAYGEESIVGTFLATLGRTLFKTDNGYGVTIIVHGKDFIFDKNAIPFIPKRGDIIIYDGMKFEVLAPGNEPVWRYSGVNNSSIRVHTKEVTEVDNG